MTPEIRNRWSDCSWPNIGFFVHGQARGDIAALLDLIQSIKDALGTDEDDAALVEVARNAHRAEQELAATLQRLPI
jgi:hypothetical protein